MLSNCLRAIRLSILCNGEDISAPSLKHSVASCFRHPAAAMPAFVCFASCFITDATAHYTSWSTLAACTLHCTSCHLQVVCTCTVIFTTLFLSPVQPGTTYRLRCNWPWILYLLLVSASPFWLFWLLHLFSLPAWQPILWKQKYIRNGRFQAILKPSHN